MRREQAGELGMVVLGDHHDRAVGLVANDHAPLTFDCHRKTIQTL
jgi:hypothetical protein